VNFRCDDTLLQMYVDGSLGAVERMIIEEHVKVCRQCGQQVALYKGLLWDLEHPVPIEIPPELDALSDRLMDAWAEAQAPERWQEASLVWTETVPAFGFTLGTAERVGRSLGHYGMVGLASLWRLIRKGGGNR